MNQHPLAGKIFRLKTEGYSQRQIAAQVELSQSTVQRILNGPVPDDTDPDGVLAEFNELARTARAQDTLDAYRHVHEVALTCHANGYGVPFWSLPYLMLLAQLTIEALKREREAYRAETTTVYQDMKDYRDQNG